MEKLEVWEDSHSVNKIGLHIIWCTKYRKPVLIGKVELTVKRTIGEVCIEYGWACRTVEVMPDHVHLFIQIHPTDRPCDVVRTLKSITAVAVFTEFLELKKQKFWGSGLWSRGTFYSSVGHISQETVIKYIENQKSK